MGKSLTTTKNSFLLLFSYIENVMFCWKISLKKFSYITRLVLHIFCVADSLRRSNKTSTPIQICIGLVVNLQPKILGNRQVILAQISIAMDYYQWIDYLRDTHITVTGMRNIVFPSVLRILLICKFLNFTWQSSLMGKCKHFQSLHTVFCVRKFISV